MDIIHEELHVWCVIIYHKGVKDGTKEEIMYLTFSFKKSVELTCKSVTKDKIAVHWFVRLCRRWMR